jgi:hypothetical protein
MGSHDIDELYCMHQHFYVFINIGLLMAYSVRKLLQNFEIINKKVVVSEYLFHVINSVQHTHIIM